MIEGSCAGRELCVCVPVRNEQALLPALLAALAAQRDLPDAMAVALLFDSCTDASEAIVGDVAPRLPFRVVTDRVAWDGPPNAGRARAAAMALGARTVAGPALLLSTDADSAPVPDWIAANRAALAHVDVVAGRIVGAHAAETPAARLEAYYDRLYALRRRLDPVPWDPAPAHHFASGASLGFRAEAYAALGGFAPQPCGEDGEIVDRAQRAGLRVRRDPAVVVATSPRRDGRASGGLATMLDRLDRDGGAGGMRVAHPAGAAWQYRAHAAARAAFARADDPAILPRFAQAIGAHPDALRRLAAEVPNAEAFAIRAVPAPPGEQLVPLDAACAALDLIETGCEERAA